MNLKQAYENIKNGDLHILYQDNNFLYKAIFIKNQVFILSHGYGKYYDYLFLNQFFKLKGSYKNIGNYKANKGITNYKIKILK